MEPATATRMGNILDSTRSLDDVQRALIFDASTIWFGIVRRSSDRSELLEFNRYDALLLNPQRTRDPTDCFPRLVSFIGATNAGKSAVVRMLIESEPVPHGWGPNQFPSPVVGSTANDAVPTSGDVHLYADPLTCESRTPILFLDCEGFEAGERTPLGSRSLEAFSTYPDSLEHLGLDTPSIWPMNFPNHTPLSSREHAVTTFYPRLLYTFSDCVVFVLRNAKTFQSTVLSKLIDWGVAAFEQSLNSPGLPHCIVVLNASDPGLPPGQWDTRSATRDLLATAKGALDGKEGVTRLRELAQQWRALGKKTSTIEQLILHYYASFTVVRIPARPSYMRIRQQTLELRSEIQRKCAMSFEARKRSNMLIDAAGSQAMFRRAFEHFATAPDQPFDFGQVSLAQSPIPVGFDRHIVHFCSLLTAQQARPTRAWTEWMFEKVSVLLASCVVLDSTRSRKGRRLQLFADYEGCFERAITEYFERVYPSSSMRVNGERRSLATKAAHPVKDHPKATSIIAADRHPSDVDVAFTQRWMAQLKAAIDARRAALQQALHPSLRKSQYVNFESDTAAMLHVKCLDQFYDALGPASNFISNTIDLCCLMEGHPPNALPCGHAICDSCVKTFGIELPHGDAFELRGCPIHLGETQWAEPVVVRYKPRECGARILALESGGTRAIVQMEALLMIERLTGSAITSLFDLIVGAGTGGLVAILLSQKGKTLSECIDTVVDICNDAYATALDATPLVSHIVRKIKNGIGEREARLYKALQKAFPADRPFDHTSNPSASHCRIAVVARTLTGRPALLANYRRKHDAGADYDFECSTKRQHPLRTWQCAAATLSQSDRFDPFRCEETTYHADPDHATRVFEVAQREAEAIWPDAGQPELLLSLGTGHDADASRTTITSAKFGNDVPRRSSTYARAADGRSGRTKSTISHDDSGVVAMEHSWEESRRTGAPGARVRLNPDLGRDTLSADWTSGARRLQLREKLREPANRTCLEGVAHRLLAAQFFFRAETPPVDGSGRHIQAGRILCRSPSGSEELRALGRLLLRRQTATFRPYFAVRPGCDPTYNKIDITSDDIRALIEGDRPCQWPVRVSLRSAGLPVAITITFSAQDTVQPEGYCIGGLPQAPASHLESPRHCSVGVPTSPPRRHTS